MTPELQLKAFEAHVKKIHPKFNKRNSSLKGVFDVIEAQIKAKKYSRLDAAEISNLVKTSKSDGGEKYEKYKPALDSLVAAWGSDRDYDADGGGGAEAKAGPGLPALTKWATDRKKALDPLANYYVNDWRTFAHVLNKKKVPEAAMEERKAGINEVELGKAQNAATIAQAMLKKPADTVKPPTLKIVNEATNKAKAAICTTFAFSTAHVLSKDEGAPRVEVISHSAGHAGTHCFVIIGRPPESVLAKSETWIKESVVVDAWAAALGHNMIYTPAKSFQVSPIESDAKNLKSIFDSDKLE